MTLFSKLGACMALAKLGVATMLPQATARAVRVGKNIKGLQTELSAAVPKTVLSEKPLHQYLSISGGGSPTESATSRWFRSELHKQINPQEFARIPTLPPPPRLPGAANMATVRPARR